MRTTVDIQDDLLIQLKQRAARSRRPLRELIEDAIRASLARSEEARDRTDSQRVVTFKGRGVRRGVNLDSMRELLDIMEGTP
jgi:metal-responsive CopG/Arc/MetJ family transcriptional regulator